MFYLPSFKLKSSHLRLEEGKCSPYIMHESPPLFQRSHFMTYLFSDKLPRLRAVEWDAVHGRSKAGRFHPCFDTSVMKPGINSSVHRASIHRSQTSCRSWASISRDFILREGGDRRHLGSSRVWLDGGDNHHYTTT